MVLPKCVANGEFRHHGLRTRTLTGAHLLFVRRQYHRRQRALPVRLCNRIGSLTPVRRGQLVHRPHKGATTNIFRIRVFTRQYRLNNRQIPHRRLLTLRGRQISQRCMGLTNKSHRQCLGNLLLAGYRHIHTNRQRGDDRQGRRYTLRSQTFRPFASAFFYTTPSADLGQC